VINEVVDRTVKIVDRTAKVMDRTVKIVDRAAEVVDRTIKATERSQNDEVVDWNQGWSTPCGSSDAPRNRPAER